MKGSAVKALTHAINQLKSVLVCADPALREDLAALANPHLIKHCAQLDDGPAGAARHTLRLLARRIQHLTEEIDDLVKRIAQAVKACRPALLEMRGIPTAPPPCSSRPATTPNA